MIPIAGGSFGQMCGCCSSVSSGASFLIGRGSILIDSTRVLRQNLTSDRQYQGFKASILIDSTRVLRQRLLLIDSTRVLRQKLNSDRQYQGFKAGASFLIARCNSDRQYQGFKAETHF